MQIMAGTPQMKLFTTLLIDSIVANITSSPFLFINHIFVCYLRYLHYHLNFNCSSIARFLYKKYRISFSLSEDYPKFHTRTSFLF